jgi:DNA polymerase III sliding clamp (beta) subunit (PCNA family)
VSFESDGTLLSDGPLAGKYPDYRLIMPRAIVASARLNREAMLSVCGLLDPADTYVTFRFGRSDVVSLRNRADGRVAEATLEGVAAAETNSGDRDLTLSARYLAEALNTMAASHVLLSSGGSRAATVLTELGGAPDFRHVIMPAAPE